jgi:hypothetical protein
MRLRPVVAHVLAGLLAGFAVPAVACAQIRASEHATVTQRVSTTTISMEYDRPVTRGRTLFGPGGVVKWGEIWTPGANWATTIDVDRDATVEGQTLPKGKYSLWLTPQAPPAAWTLSFSRVTKRFHTRPPGAADEQLHVSVKPEQGMHMEALLWYMPVVRPDGVTLRMHWGTTMVPVRIGVELPRLVSLPADELPMYVGTYRVHMTPSGRPAYDAEFTIREDRGALRIRSVPENVFYEELLMVPVADGRFHVAYAEVGSFNGRPYTEPGMIFAFRMADGRARSLDMYGYDDTVIGRGELVK